PAPFSRNWEALVGDRVSHHAIGGTHRTIMQAPHLQRVAAAMSEALESAGAERQPMSEYAPLQPIQLTVSARATIFCVPGAGASIACFLQLAHALGGDVDVYGLQPRGLQRGEVPHS